MLKKGGEKRWFWVLLLKRPILEGETPEDGFCWCHRAQACVHGEHTTHMHAALHAHTALHTPDILLLPEP